MTVSITRFGLKCSIHYLIILIVAVLQSTTVEAKCNGWHARWCGSHYGAEVNHIKYNVIPNLNARATIIPVQIADKNHERDLVGQMIQAADREVTLQNRIIAKDQAMITLFDKELIPSAREAEANIIALNTKIVARLPVMITYLRDFLVKRNQSLESRIQELNAELIGFEDPSKVDALLFEKTHLENLRVFSQGFADQELFNKALAEIAQGRFDTEAANLSMETVALIQEAATLRDLNVSAADLFSSIRKGVQTLVDQLSAQMTAAENEITSRRLELDQAISRKQNVHAQYVEVTQSINTLQAELTSIPAQISQWWVRHNNADLYWHCCDNEPFCRYLPDADQNPAAYARYEASISPSRHSKKCHDGGDL